MSRPAFRRKTIVLAAVLLPLFGLFVYVAVRSGPLAPTPVVVVPVQTAPLSPVLFGIGTVQARYAYKIGPTAAGRVARVHVDVGDRINAGQLLAEIDPVDLDDRIRAQEAAAKRAKSQLLAAEAQARDARARLAYTETEAHRYTELLGARAVSEETRDVKVRELEAAAASYAATVANWDAAAREVDRLAAERNALSRQRASLRLTAPASGVVTARNAEPGTTLIAGQSVVDAIDPTKLWISVRFDQATAAGLAVGQPVKIALRSRPGATFSGRVQRVEPNADPVTEEILAKVVFDAPPVPLPPLGELAEASVALNALPPTTVVPNAAVHRVDGALGVWTINEGKLRFVQVKLGANDLDGNVQVLAGLRGGEQLVLYSHQSLRARSRITVVEALGGRRS